MPKNAESHIHMIKETLLQLVDGTERTVLLKRIIFVCIEYNNIAEAQGLLVVTALNPQSPDYSIQIGFLQTMVDLPWNSYTQDDLSLTLYYFNIAYH